MMRPLEPKELRRQVYGVLITLAMGVALGRLISVERLNEPSVHRADTDTSTPRPRWPSTRPDPWPTFGSNDRSRFAAVRSLVEQGTFVIGSRDPLVVLSSCPTVLAAQNAIQAAILFEAGYRLRIKSDTGIIFEEGWQSVDKVLHPSRFEYYSTKPPLLTVIAAGEYWILRKVFGLDIVKDRWIVIGTIVGTMNLVPFFIYLCLLACMAERLAENDWSRYFIIGAAGFATLVSPFLITFNNHTVATTGVMIALYSVARIREGGGSLWYLLAGLAAGFTACNELPSLSLAAALGCYLLILNPVRALTFFLPAALLPGLLMTGINYIELGQFRPAYAEFGTVWYEYEGSHWRVPKHIIKRGIDFAGRNGEPRLTYAFHLLLGHHGWFSLMPMMFLGLAGMILWSVDWLTTRPLLSTEKPAGPQLGILTLLVSIVVIGFYLYKSDNYGGWSNGPRWLMWLTPLWLISLLPILDRLGRSKAGRLLALVLLLLSAMSMNYQSWSPWRHPWIYNWMETRNWISY